MESISSQPLGGSLRPFAHGAFSSEELALLSRLAAELNVEEAQRSVQPKMEDLANDLSNMLWHRSSEGVEPFRQKRQEFLLRIGQAIERLSPLIQNSYPREFLDQMVQGIQDLKPLLGFSDEAIQHLILKWRPWSEEVIYWGEMGKREMERMPAVGSWVRSMGGQKIAKSEALMQTYEHLQNTLLERKEERSLIVALLEFDRAWWELLYLHYDPITAESPEERVREIERRIAAFVDEKLKAYRTLASNEGLLDELMKGMKPFMDVMMRQFPQTEEVTPPEWMREINEALFDGQSPPMTGPMKEEVPPLVRTMMQTSTLFLQMEPLLTQNPSLVEAKPEAPQIPPTSPAHTPVTSIDREKILVGLGEVKERVVDYSLYSGRLQEFIADHFDIVLQGDLVQNLTDVKEIYIPDIHGSMGHRCLYTAMVNLFATKESIVFVELVKALQRCEADEAFHTVSMSTPALLVGWDLFPSEITSDPRVLENGDRERIHDRLLYGLLSPELSEEERLRFLKEFVDLRVDSLGIDPSFIEELLPLLPKTFPQRVHSMIDSVKELSPKSDRSFIIAGEKHLISEEGTKEDSRFDLQDFLSFVKGRNALVLKPKQKSLGEANAPFVAFLIRFRRAWVDAVVHTMVST